ncbi:stage II sporulation protein M [Methanopyrus kandleri]|uniref:Stage II sporulation protein M n=1 Tax=Methanopyrus kandleri TaxID=2320 RepID=A0A832TCP5_9EURY|nr:stage II sporulation protein M [Methanopyrus kandleri]HII70403.1 stage II sporulation protein M [Methanopyrus kandleri]
MGSPWRYIVTVADVFLISGFLGMIAYFMFPSLPDIILKTTCQKVEALARLLPFPMERFMLSITLWNTMTILITTFGGLIALTLDRLVTRYAPDVLRRSMNNPPYAPILVKLARKLGFDVRRYKEADVILTLKLGPLLIPAINGFAAGAFGMWVLQNFGPVFLLGAALLPHGVIEFPTLIIAGAMGVHLADYLIYRVRLHERWPHGNLEVPSWVIRNTAACIAGLTVAAYLEVHITPIVAGCVMKCA